MSETMIWIAAAAAILLVIVGIALFAGRTRRSLRRRFGNEYDRAVAQHDSREAAHQELQSRIERRGGYEVRDLDDSAAVAYVERWREIQRAFVADPATGLLEADALVVEVAEQRGYPAEGWDRQAADISVDHPDTMDDYRHARAVAYDTRDGTAGTEEMRDALLRYRTMFERLVGRQVTEGDR
ncbi:MAG TPA: hypothetical protein VK875_01970 [Euzebyales bacterium]|nr:hypothetical protein [Euzebyales bacterium]